MFPGEKIAAVNANRVGEHPPETLLAVGQAEAVRPPRGCPTWNHFVHPEDGRARPVAGTRLIPLFRAVEFTAADMAGVAVKDCPPGFVRASAPAAAAERRGDRSPDPQSHRSRTHSG
jgi:hypothetical protein